MNDDFDLSSLIDDTKKKPRSSGKKLESNLIRKGVSRKKVAEAKGAKLIKGRKRKTIFLPPELIEEIDAAAKQEGVQLMDFYHWLVTEAWKAYGDGEIRPSVTEVIQVVRGLSIDGYNQGNE